MSIDITKTEKVKFNKKLTPCATCDNAVEGVLVDDTYMLVKCKKYDLFIPIAQECKDYKNERGEN